MRKWKDNEGRDWSITVNVTSIKNVRDVTGINLSGLFKDQAQALFDDIVMFVDVLWVLTEAQATHRGVTQEQFAAGLVGDAIENAADALLEDVIDFFPSGRRAIFRATKNKADAAAKLMEAKAMAAIESMSFESASKSQA